MGTNFHHFCFFFFQAEDGIRDLYVTGGQTCARPISRPGEAAIFEMACWKTRSARAAGKICPAMLSLGTRAARETACWFTLITLRSPRPGEAAIFEMACWKTRSARAAGKSGRPDAQRGWPSRRWLCSAWKAAAILNPGPL